MRPIYFVPREDLVGEVLIPALKLADSVDCMVGFFSGQSLAVLAPGLASFVSNGDRPLRLIVCPVLSTADKEAIDEGYKAPSDVVEKFIGDGLSVADGLAQHTLKCLAYLIGMGRLEIQIAVMKDALFHPKVWIISSGQDALAVHGSGNMTVSGLSKNYEQITVDNNWGSEDGRFVVERFRAEFDEFWSGNSTICNVYDFPEALAKRLVREYSGREVPTESELLALLEEGKAPTTPLVAEKRPFAIPLHLDYSSGDFAHQGKAALAFAENGYRGILAMATGSGKTITSMIAAHELYKREKKLLIVVAAPYLPLIDQWCREMSEFGLEPRNLSLLIGDKARNQELAAAARRLRHATIPATEAVVVTHNTLCDLGFQAALARAEVPVLLIADEMHNLGRPEFIAHPPTEVPFRLGLSATPVRQYDEEGTAALQEYFGSTVFVFSLEQAINVCLVPYDYHIHPLQLSETELDEWRELTEKIKKDWWKTSSNDPKDATYIQTLLQRRRLILESAEEKLRCLAKLLDEEGFAAIRHTLIYATDKDPKQLAAVNQMLRERGIRFHELTAAQSGDRDLTGRILDAFKKADIQVLTAKRVLDEGVNIPEIAKAFVLASTTVERQWVQRRGRLLRKCKEIGKEIGVIHDFLVVPPDAASDLDTRAIVRGELARANEFARLSRNFGAPGGALAVIDPIVKRFFLDSGDAYAAG